MVASAHRINHIVGDYVQSPRKSMPTMAKIIDHWTDNWEGPFPKLRCKEIGWGEPFCFRCGWLSPKDRWGEKGGLLERAHLHDHMWGGDETTENLVPLCIRCHEGMPQCKSRGEGVEYVNDVVQCPWYVQMMTDALKPGSAETYWKSLALALASSFAIRDRNFFFPYIDEVVNYGCPEEGAFRFGQLGKVTRYRLLGATL